MKVLKSVKCSLKYAYLSSTRTKTNQYWKPVRNKQVVTVTPHTIVNPFIYVYIIKRISRIRRMFYIKKKYNKELLRDTI